MSELELLNSLFIYGEILTIKLLDKEKLQDKISLC